MNKFITWLFLLIAVMTSLIPASRGDVYSRRDGHKIDNWNVSPLSTPYLGRGYNMREGNPEGRSLYNREGDPGLRPTRSIVQNDPNCDGCASSSAIVDDYIIKAYLANDVDKYRRQVEDRWTEENPDYDEGYSGCSWYYGTDRYASKPKSGLRVGGAVQAVQEVEKLLNESVMLTKETTHVYEVARLVRRNGFLLNPEFSEHLCKLPRNVTDEFRRNFTNFFDDWGTHFITELSLGEMELRRQVFGREIYKKVLLQMGIDDEDSKSLPGVFSNVAILNAKTYVSDRGSKQVPFPVRMTLEPISELAYIHNACRHLGSDDRCQLREVVLEEMKEYLASSGN